MRVHLAYGEHGLDVDLPDDRTTVIEPRYVPGAPDAVAVLRTALREPVAGPPLREIVRPGQTVAISVCDGTRAQPRDLVVPAVLDELAGIVDLDDVLILVATGTHRGNTDAEIRAMLGDVVDRVRVVNHDARDEASLVWMGTHGNGVPVWPDRRWVEADVRITTGFVAHVVAALATPDGVARVRGVLLRETTTLGVRETPVVRHAVRRTFGTVDVDGQPAPSSSGGGRTARCSTPCRSGGRRARGRRPGPAGHAGAGPRPRARRGAGRRPAARRGMTPAAPAAQSRPWRRRPGCPSAAGGALPAVAPCAYCGVVT